MQAYNGVTVGDFATLIGKSPYLLIVRAIAPYLEETYADLCVVHTGRGACCHLQLRVCRPDRRRKARCSHGDAALAALRLFLGRGPYLFELRRPSSG
jgi:hypothetical protein